METVSLGVAGSRRPESIVRLAKTRSGFEGRRSTRSIFSDYSPMVCTLAGALSLAAVSVPSNASAQGKLSSPPYQNLSSVPTIPNVTLRVPDLHLSAPNGDHSHFTPHSSSPHRDTYDPGEANLEGNEVLNVGNVNLPMVPLDHRHGEARGEPSEPLAVRQESVNFASFTGRLRWSHHFADSWVALQRCIDENTPCAQVLSTNLTVGYARGTTILLAGESSSPTRFYGQTDTGMVGASVLFGFRLPDVTLFTNLGLYGRYNQTSAARNVNVDGRERRVEFNDENLALGPLTLDVRAIFSGRVNARFGAAFYTPASSWTNAAVYGGPEVNWNRRISTILTVGYTNMDLQNVLFGEILPVYFNVPALGGHIGGGIGIKVDGNITHHFTILDLFAEGCYTGNRVSFCGIIGREGPIDHYLDLGAVREAEHYDPPMPLYGVATLTVTTSSGASSNGSPAQHHSH